MIYQVFYYSMSKGQLSLTGTIIAAYPLFTILFSHLFLGERLAGWQYGGVALILARGSARGHAAAPGARSRRGDLSWVLWGVLGAASIGTGDFLSKFSVNRIGPYANLFFLALAQQRHLRIQLPAGPGKPAAAPLRLTPVSGSALMGIVVHLVGALGFLIAFGFGPASLVSSVSSIYPAFLVLLAVVFLHETGSPGVRPAESAPSSPAWF